MFRLIGFLVIFAATAGGYLYFDYRMSAKWAGNEGSDDLTFTEYLSGFSSRLASLTGSASGGLPTRLADMLPVPPEGWTVRPTEPKDVEGFLPKTTGKTTDRSAIAAITEVGSAAGASGTEVALLTYEKGDRKVVIKAVRYPNMVFTSSASLSQRMELRMIAPQFRGTEFATVRGLDVTEDLLPDGFRGRYFLADVGAQIHLRILAPKRMTDEDLLPFLETLHVRAMNAGVIEKAEGLGEVPVIVLASALDEPAREAYLADLAVRKAGKAARIAEDQKAAEAAAATPAKSDGGFLGGLFGSDDEEAPAAEAPVEGGKIECTTGNDGVKRCAASAPAEK